MISSKKRRLRDQLAGPATLIGHGCKITGVLTGAGNFQISGEIEGDCDLDGSVTITESGIWKGAICANTIIISGTVDGIIEATGGVEISETARIKGSIKGSAIAVAEGAVVEGVMNTTGRTAPVHFKEKRKTAEETGA